MIFKTYQIYLSKVFTFTLFKTFAIFLSLTFILNIFEEINFFKDLKVSITLPIFLTFLNIPSVLFDIFPFIFLITSQFAFIKLMDQNEIIVLKNFGLDNLRIIKILSILSFIIGLTIITIYYNFSSSLKYSYLNLKNSYAKDNKYLAVITENGLWIKDEIDNKINIINAEKIIGDELINVEIIQFDYSFTFEKTIVAKKVNVKDFVWSINDAKISEDNFNKTINEDLKFISNFNAEKINNLFSNLTSLNFFELKSTKENYKELGYSTIDIDTHIQKIFAYPFYLIIMTLFSGIIMTNIKHNKPKIFNLTIGILLSVIIYYINYFSAVLGQNFSLPVSVAVWAPMAIILLSCTIGMVRINEK